MLVLAETRGNDWKEKELEMTKKWLPKAFAEKRLLTFRKWPHAKPSAKEMADAGFFYEGDRDRVRCFWCYILLQDWETKDDPFEEHAKWSGKCPVFGKQEETINV